MSSSEKVRAKLEKKKSVEFAEKMSAKLETIGSETCIQPRFASHTMSSLMKTRTPLNLKKKSSSMRNARASKKSQKRISIIYMRHSGIYKRRSVTKHSKSKRILMTILKKQKDRPAPASRQDSELTGTQGVYEFAENSLVFLPSDLIRDVSRDLRKYASPVKSVIPGKPTKVVDQLEKHVEDSHTHLQKKIGCIDSYLSSCLQSNTENIHDNVKNRTVVGIARQSQSRREEEKFVESSHREVRVLHHRSTSEAGERLSNENCPAIETRIHRQSVSANVNDAPTDCRYVFRRGNRRTWANFRRAETRYVDANSQDSRNFEFMRHDDSRNKDDRSVVNYANRRGACQRNLDFINQRVWRPPGITRSSVIKSTMSLTQPTSQWSRSTDKSIASTNKYSSIKHIEMLNSDPMTTSINQSKMMKENRDPRANRVTKICEHFTKAKGQQGLQSRGTLSKERRSTNKINSKTLNNLNNANPTRSRSRSKSRSRYWQTVTPRESSRKWNKQSHTESIASHSRRPRPSEVIHALKEIIDSARENEDVEKDAVDLSNNDVCNNKKDADKFQVSIRDVSTEISRNDEAHFINNKHFDESNRSFDQYVWKSISTQTEKGLDSEILKFTQISMQSSNCNNVIETGCNTHNNVIETGCNTTHNNAIRKDAGVSCDLIDLDKILTLEDTEYITHAENNVEDTYSDKNKKFSINKCKESLSTETILKLQDYDIMGETSAKMTSFIRNEEKIIDENSQTLLKLPKNSDDKMNIDIDTFQASIKYSNDSVNNLFLEKSHRSSSSIYDYEVSCSSEDLAEHLENDIQHGNMVMSELNIPSDVIAAFELAAERARNLRKAIVIYYENLISRETEKREEEIEDYETIKKCASFINCEIENRKRSDCDAKYCDFVAYGENIDRFSTCSSRSSNSDEMYESTLQKLSLADYCDLVDKKKIKWLDKLVLQAMQKEYTLEVLKSRETENNDGDFDAAGTIKTLALPTVEKTSSIISYGNLLALIYCILCSIIFWYLQVSFRCDPAM